MKIFLSYLVKGRVWPSKHMEGNHVKETRELKKIFKSERRGPARLSALESLERWEKLCVPLLGGAGGAFHKRPVKT